MHNVSSFNVLRTSIDDRQTPVRENTLRGVLGIIFNKDLDKVLLILRNRPDFAKGKYNGVGGKHEANETDQACASREVREEAGIEIDELAWETVAHIEWKTWDGAVLTTVWQGEEDEVKSLTDEPVSWHKVTELPENCMRNIHWMVPLAKDVLLEKYIGTEFNDKDYPRDLYMKVTYQPLFD